jgi:hypothetical protein
LVEIYFVGQFFLVEIFVWSKKEISVEKQFGQKMLGVGGEYRV